MSFLHPEFSTFVENQFSKINFCRKSVFENPNFAEKSRKIRIKNSEKKYRKILKKIGKREIKI